MSELSEAPPEGAERRWKAVYTIVDGPNDKKFWLRIGIAFPNRDASLNVKLDATPVNGTLHIRDPDPRDEGRGHRGGDRFGGGARGRGGAGRDPIEALGGKEVA